MYLPYLIPEGHEYQYDLGWLVRKIMSFETELNTAIDLKTIHYADPLQWDITTQYSPNTVVVDPKTGTAYMSKVPVPSGVQLTNTDYWVVVFNYQRIYDKIMSGVAFNDKDNLNASKDLLVNDLVWYGGDLYRCTRAIPHGTTYIPGTNLTPTTIADCLATYYGRDRVAQVLNDTVNVSGDYTLNAGDIAETASNVTIHSTQDMVLDADGSLTEQIAGGKTSEVGGKRTERITGNQEIDVDGDDSIHVDGVTSINRGGAVTEVYGSSVDKRVTGAFTESFEDTATKTYNGKLINKAADVINNAASITTTVNDLYTIQSNDFIYNDVSINKLLKTQPVNVLSLGVDNTGTNDVTDVLNELTKSYNLYLPSGTYLVNGQLSPVNDIIGEGRSRGTSNTHTILKRTTPSTLAVIKTSSNKSITLKGFDIVLDGDGDCDGINLSDTDVCFLIIQDITVYGVCKGSGISLTPSIPISKYAVIDNVSIFGIVGKDSLGLYIGEKAVDCRITNAELMILSVGVHSRAIYTYMADCHIWTGSVSGQLPTDKYANTVGVYGFNASINAVNLYIDTAYVPFKPDGNSRFNVSNIFIYYDETASLTDGSLSYGTGSLYIDGGVIYPDGRLPNLLTNINTRLSNVRIMRDTAYSGDFAIPSTFTNNTYILPGGTTGYSVKFTCKLSNMTRHVRLSTSTGDLVDVNINVNNGSVTATKKTSHGNINVYYKIINDALHLFTDDFNIDYNVIDNNPILSAPAINYSLISKIDGSAYDRLHQSTASGLTQIMETQ